MTRQGLDAPAVLADGAWVAVRGVLRWVPVVEQIPEHGTTRLIACPTCRAAIDERCRTRAGRPRPEHATRLVGRRCPCGEVIPRKHRQKWCVGCKVEARRAQQQQADSRRRDAKRDYDRARRAA